MYYFRVIEFIFNRFNKGEIVVFIGCDGAGKSTMMKIIAGEQRPSRGNVRFPKDAIIAYLPQHLLTEDDCTVFEEASKAFNHIFEMRDEMEQSFKK